MLGVLPCGCTILYVPVLCLDTSSYIMIERIVLLDFIHRLVSQKIEE
jgi:hypothetical protein